MHKGELNKEEVSLYIQGHIDALKWVLKHPGSDKIRQKLSELEKSISQEEENKSSNLKVCTKFEDFSKLLFLADKGYLPEFCINDLISPAPLAFEYVGTSMGQDVYKALYPPTTGSDKYMVMIFNAYKEDEKTFIFYEYLNNEGKLKGGISFSSDNEKSTRAMYNKVKKPENFIITTCY